MITEPSGEEVMLSGKIRSPFMTISAGGAAACAIATAPVRVAAARLEANFLSLICEGILGLVVAQWE